MKSTDYEELKRKVEAEIRGQSAAANSSVEYQAFKKQYLPKRLTIYESLCRFTQGLGIAPTADEAKRYEEAIEVCHLSVTPSGVYGLALLAPALLLFAGLFFAILLPLLLGSSMSLFFFSLSAAVAIAIYFPLKSLPYTLADNWRMDASNQMVLSLFYITTYMRHTSNLERAIDFAAEHTGPPLALDLKKVLWDVQTEKYSSIQESLDHYLLRWKDSNLEFVEAMNLVQASLYETSQERRLNSLEKAMSLILEETYEKMLHYAQNLKSPMTMLHMLGIILPILGLVILPLAVSFLEEVRWYHILVLYNIILPLGVYFLGKGILAKRPNGYGSADITDINPQLKRFKTHIISLPGGTSLEISPAIEALFIGGLLVFIGLLPIIIHVLSPSFDMTLGAFSLLQYTQYKGAVIGPFGLGAALLSLFLTLGIGLGLAHYYNVRSSRIIKIRADAKLLEQEFAGALFQLGNRLGDGIPAEIAFSKVADVMTGTKSGEFFRAVSNNIEELGMSVEQSIFDLHRGAIMLFPSPIIESSMKVLVESSKKGPLEASQALITMSNYIKEIHRVEERLKDLLSDIISGMKSQISFLTPAIAGIVIGITSMITTILLQLQTKFAEFGADAASGSSVSSFATLLGIGIPTYYFQFIVGLYVIQITWILAYLVNGIENGNDDLNGEYEQGRGLRLGTLLYVFISFAVMLLFNLIAGTVLSGVA